MEVSPAKSLILSATIHGGSYFFIQPEKLMKQLSEEKYIIIVVTHDYEFLNRACKRYIRINS